MSEGFYRGGARLCKRADAALTRSRNHLSVGRSFLTRHERSRSPRSPRHALPPHLTRSAPPSLPSLRRRPSAVLPHASFSRPFSLSHCQKNTPRGPGGAMPPARRSCFTPRMVPAPPAARSSPAAAPAPLADARPLPPPDVGKESARWSPSPAQPPRRYPDAPEAPAAKAKDGWPKAPPPPG